MVCLERRRLKRVHASEHHGSPRALGEKIRAIGAVRVLHASGMKHTTPTRSGVSAGQDATGG